MPATLIWELFLTHDLRLNATWRDDFVFHVARGCPAYSLGGQLGSSAKFLPGEWRVTLPAEDQLPHRARLLAAVNQALQELRQRWEGRDGG